MKEQQTSPRQRYSQDLKSGLIVHDPAQELVVRELDALFRRLTNRSVKFDGVRGYLRRWLKREEISNEPVQGLYVWGGVGRGKTYLMDLFYECLPFEEKQRTHFHRFMQFVHSELTRLQGEKNPLERLADLISTESRVLCFDEFFVLDIGDAMILAGLLEALFKRHVVLVTTSNIHPDGLYENGLQRQRFVPAIELLKKHTKVVELASESDYRLRSLEQANLYLYPLTDDTDDQLSEKFIELTRKAGTESQGAELIILGRPIMSKWYSADVAWFAFSELCGGPRSAFDYVEIAKIFHTLIISDVPVMTEADNDLARRFISLIDEVYDRRVKLVMSAEVEIGGLYTGQSLAFPFERTCSRLLEMQSHEYLCSAHQA